MSTFVFFSALRIFDLLAALPSARLRLAALLWRLRTLGALQRHFVRSSYTLCFVRLWKPNTCFEITPGRLARSVIKIQRLKGFEL